MFRRALQLGALCLVFPTLALAQGRDSKVYYDNGFHLGSQPLARYATRYFEVLTTPAREDPHGDVLRYWGPKLDRFFSAVTDNLGLSRAEVNRYLVFSDYFTALEKLRLEGRLASADFDTVLARTVAVEECGAARPAQPMLFLAPACSHPKAGIGRTASHFRHGNCIVVAGDTVLVQLPGDPERCRQRCVLYRTLADFMATPIGPVLPEGVLGFVPRHDPARPVVIYASLGEQRLNRTAQHEIGHAVVEGVSTYLRGLAVTRMLNAPRDTVAAKPWRPSSGGFAAITHENYAEYLAFPPGEMDARLRTALVELVADNQLDGLAAISVGARTLASSYIEGPARLAFLAENFGRDIPKRLLIEYYTGSLGFLDVIEKLTGKKMPELEQLYLRWLRERFWATALAADIPDTMGSVLTSGLAGVRRDGLLLVQRYRKGRQEIVLVGPERRHRGPRERLVARELDGIEMLPLFSTPDLRAGRVVAVVRCRNEESLLLYDVARGKRRIRPLHGLGAVREIRDPRLSADGKAVVCRVVDRSGRNALVHVDLEHDRVHAIVPWQWAEMANPSFAGCDSLVLFSCTATSDHCGDVMCVATVTGEIRNLTCTPGESETEPLLVNGHLLCLTERAGLVEPVEVLPGGKRELVKMPFPVERLQSSDSTLTLVASSLRHQRNPAGRAVWDFPLRRLGLQKDLQGETPWNRGAPWNDLARRAQAFEGVSRREGGAVAEPGASAAPEVALAAWIQVGGSAGRGASRAARAAPAASRSEHATPAVKGQGDAAHEPNPIDVAGTAMVTPYKQKWRLMPLGLNLGGSGQTARGVSFMGFDTEFHDQSVILAAGQSGSFDRFGMVQYRNLASRTHWQVTGYHRSVVRSRYLPESLATTDRRESEQGLLLSAQYHKSLVTRLGLGLSLARSSDADGAIAIQSTDSQQQAGVNAPLLGLQLHGIRPSTWEASLGGLPNLSILQDRSPAGLAAWTQAVQQSADQEPQFQPTLEYVRPAARLGASLSRDTRVWSDYRGPDSGSLLVLEVSGGLSAPGKRTWLNAARQDSLAEHVPAGLERLAGTWLFLTHRRLAFVDLAFRCRGLLNDGPQALTYGLGGIYSVAGYPQAGIRSQRVAWTNTEARAQLWDYSTWKLPIRSLVFPAADGFLYVDSGIADGAQPLLSHGLGLRLRLGFLAFEWRQALRNGLRNQRGLALVW